MLLDKLFGSKTRSKILNWLLLHPEERYFVRQLQSIIKEDPTNTSRELSRLGKMGILTSQTEGKQKYYQANRSCPFFSELQGLVIKTSGVVEVLRAALEPLVGKIDVAFIYGSFARDKLRPESDIDLVVIGRCRFGEVVDAIHKSQERIGREINPTVFSHKEWKKKLAEGHHFAKSIKETEKIFIIGSEDELAGLAR
jgi:predicted nucleotidyltransferase